MGPKDSFDVFYYAKLFLESKPQRTLRDDEVAPVFREPGVKTGYRLPGRNWGYYLASLFHVHSETLNVWTHLVGCVMMVYYLYSYALQYGVWIDESRRVIHIFNLCAVICTGLSALAHTCNSRSEFVFYISFQVDYMGIGIMTYSLGLVGFYVSCRNISLFTNMESYFLIWNTAMSWLFFLSCAYAQVMYSTKCVIRKHIIQSVSMFLHIVLSCFGILSRFYDCFYDDTCSYFALSHHMKYFLATFIAGVFFSSHFPEKFFPGKFDFACQSHQIFHVIVFYFLRLQSYAGETDHTSLKDSFPRSFPTWTAVFMSLSAVVIMDVLTILALKKYIPASHKTKST